MTDDPTIHSRVHIWANDGSGACRPGSRAQADEIVARLRGTAPQWPVSMRLFARQAQRETLAYYPDRAGLVAVLGTLVQQVEDSPCAVLTLALPADDRALATRLLLKATKDSGAAFLYFDATGVLYHHDTLSGSAWHSAEVGKWERECAELPALDELRRRSAELMAARLAPSGFALAPIDNGDYRLVRTLKDSIEQQVTVLFSSHLGRSLVTISVTAASLDLKKAKEAARINFPDGVLSHWGWLAFEERNNEPVKLFTWDDLLDIAGYLERAVVPRLDRIDSIQAFDAVLDGRIPFGPPAAMPFHDRRLAVARLAANPAYEPLKQVALQSLEGKPAEEADRLRRLIAWLDTLAPGSVPGMVADPDLPPVDRAARKAEAEKRIRQRFRAHGFKHKASASNEWNETNLLRSVGAVTQRLQFEYSASEGAWGFRLVVILKEKTVEPVAKAAKCAVNGFTWNLGGRPPGHYLMYSTWIEFERHLAACEAEALRFLDGIDSAAALQDAFFLASSPRYNRELFQRNLLFALMTAAVVGGPQEAGITARVRAEVEGIEPESLRKIRKSDLQRIDKAVQKLLGKALVAAR